jgi:hypothetical protein
MALNFHPIFIPLHQTVGQIAPQALPDNLRVVPDKEMCQGYPHSESLLRRFNLVVGDLFQAFRIPHNPASQFKRHCSLSSVI